jgi:predicted helicase
MDSRRKKNDLRRGVKYEYDPRYIVEAAYRPFTKANLYFDKHLNEMQYQLAHMFRGEPNPTIAFLCVSSSNPLAAMALNQVFDYCLLKMGNGGTQAVSRWVHDSAGNRQDNITDWALKQFTAHYKPPVRPEPVEGLEGVGGVAEASTGSARTVTGTAKGVGVGAAKPKKITKQAIFHYCYAVLHDPVYREKYAQNLKRDFPRIPLYGTSPADFWQWAAWGEALMALHIGYEAVAPFPLARTDTPDNKARAAGLPPKAILRADPAAGYITLDSETTLRGIPHEAWTYKLGNRCALDWVLDQYKEKSPRTPPFARSSTPTALPTTRKRSSTCWPASQRSAWRRCASWRR